MNNQEPRFANQLNIQWFPGHMTKTLRMMEQEIQHVDASLVLLDARIPLSSLNPEIERITARKPKLYALNKADLADPAVTEEWIKYQYVCGLGPCQGGRPSRCDQGQAVGQYREIRPAGHARRALEKV